MNIDKTAFSPPAVGLDTIGPRVAATRASAGRLRAWIIAALLLLAPLAAYWPTTFHDYGLRDDYSNLREAHEEPGKILKFCASHARPIYGLMLQASYGQISRVQDLQWMRLLASLLLGTISLVSFRSLRVLGWSFSQSLCFALLVALVPSSQVIAAWAVGWPYALAALVGVGGFFAAEGAIAAGGRRVSSLGQWAVALGLMVTSALIYQPSALFYVVPLAAALIGSRERSLRQTARWAGIHLGLLALALGLAYASMTVLYAAGVFVKSGRIAFETHWVDKISWFLREPLPNALSLFVLNDNNHRDAGLYVACAALAALILIAGAALEWRRYGRSRGLIWIAGLVVLPVCAFAVNLVASERYATYRTVLAMTAVLLCFLVASTDALLNRFNPAVRRVVAVAVIAVAFCCAEYHPYALIATTQGNEWGLIVDGAKRVRLGETRPRIFAIASTPADRSTESIYHDEFGSLSSNSEWVPREMFKRAMHDLHSKMPNVDAYYDFATGARLPAGQRFDVIIDLHRLRRFHTDN